MVISEVVFVEYWSIDNLVNKYSAMMYSTYKFVINILLISLYRMANFHLDGLLYNMILKY